MVTSQDAATAILEIVSSSPPAQGSDVAKRLRSKFPDWRPADFGVRNLREFIAKHVPTVVAAGRRGMDMLYAPEGFDLVVPPRSPSSSDYWRVWASPNSKSVLMVVRGTGELSVMPREGTSSDARYLRLEPPAAEVHMEMAKAFLAEMPTEVPLRQQLLTSLAGKVWWSEWARILRGTEFEDAWLKFRRARLEAAFSEGMLRAGVSEPVAKDATGALSPRSARRALPFSSSPGQERTERRPQVSTGHLREVVMAVVGRMSDDDLRTLKLPVGLVLEALQHGKQSAP